MAIEHNEPVAGWWSGIARNIQALIRAWWTLVKAKVSDQEREDNQVW